MDISYILNEPGEERDGCFNAVSPPIIQTSSFTFKTLMTYAPQANTHYIRPEYPACY